ncbi:IspD/TarI family cytidylyltransferase [Porphyromonas endodontalis]|uniref:IspD/TarI family cytidylyltransferase n=1 Tax=Porphyromonas endodontalis TaxID=28124 RepID=UPI003FA19075
MPKCHFVIPAGGVGLRFGGPLPKQFVEVEGLPILMHTLRAIAPYVESITLALPQDYQEYWQQVCREKSFDLKHKIVEGGATRFLSVRNAIESLAVDPDALIGVHDAVRPLVSGETIEALLAAAEASGAAIPYLPLTDSIRHLEPLVGSKSVDRAQFVAVQTPQVFLLERLRVAYQQADGGANFTDDASVYEALYDTPIELVESNPENKKITHPHDLLFLRQALNSPANR